MRKPRVKRPVEKDKPKGYDSKWEYNLHKNLIPSWDLHSQKLSYIIKHTYNPDFIKTINGITILLEAKGRFWDYQEYNKYIWIRESLPEDHELVFLFASPYAPMPATRRRKDGTKFTHSEWAEKNKFKWFSEKTFPKEWK
ncbi:MAG TPA: hypothetical protein DCM40_45250 [Maribacter sp.]|nr:hypothetical protein [Maribacter sp.]